MVRVVVVFIGSLADVIGAHAEMVEVPTDAVTVKGLIDYLQRLKPLLSKFLEASPLLQVFVNDVEAAYCKVLKNGDRVTIMLPLYEGG
ncbi:MAG: MoaD/ThiS family protein [Zestosphaera sp.]